MISYLIIYHILYSIKHRITLYLDAKKAKILSEFSFFSSIIHQTNDERTKPVNNNFDFPFSEKINRRKEN